MPLIDEAVDSVAHQGAPEVQQQAALQLRHLQIAKHLRFEHAIERGNALHLDDHLFLDDEVGAKLPELPAAMHHWKRRLLRESQGGGIELNHQATLVDILSEARPDRSMQSHRAADDALRKGIMCIHTVSSCMDNAQPFRLEIRRRAMATLQILPLSNERIVEDFALRLCGSAAI
ncbi:MAG TPA: hypothetical protein VEA16_17290 [Vicinamibacterales bacterium]|nr:hypothetical protein [Vicinamibacterales bacterium]